MKTDLILDYLRKKLGVTQEYTMIDLPQTKEDYEKNVKWIVGVDAIGSAVYEEGRPIEWQQIIDADGEAQQNLAMSLLRKERDRRIAETDWWASSDLALSDEKKIYRQKLRDVTINANPKLDEFNQLIESSVDWPMKPNT